MTKYFVLRPHALLSSYDSTIRFGEDNVVVVPLAVIDEITDMKDLSIEKDKIKRRVLEYISSFDYEELTTTGVRQANGSTLMVATNYHDVEINLQHVNQFQQRTLQICLGLQKDTKKEVVLVTNNIGLQLKAKSIGIRAEKFKDEIFPVVEQQYTGRIEIHVSRECIDNMYNSQLGYVYISDLYESEKYTWYQNAFVILRSGTATAYGKVYNEKIVRADAYKKLPYNIKAMNDGQRLLLNALYDESPLTVVKGPAGTGKTFLAMAVALEECKNRKYERILISRNVDNQKLGYLPGSPEEKVDPFLQGIKDNLEILINGTQLSEKTVVTDRRTKKCSYDDTTNKEKGDYFFEKGIIKIQALELLRGRSVMNTCFIIDEAQNIEPEFIKMIVTRASKGSKFIFLGDPTQIDNPKLTERRNGIVYLSEKMKNNNLCTVITLLDSESVRSDLAKVASEIL